MQFFAHWPGSFLGLIWIGFFSVSFPLVVALVNAGVFAGRLARESREAVERASLAASDSRLLVDHVVSLERKARQLYVLGEPELLGDYVERRNAAYETIGRLHRLSDDAKQTDRLSRMLAVEKEIHESLVAGPQQPETGAEALDRFGELNRLAREVMVESNRLAIEQADAMQKATGRTQRMLVWEASALVPVTLLVSALFASLLSKPIRRIDQGIRRLGDGDFSSEIVVRGPRDLEFLGERLDWLRRKLAELEAEKAKFLAHVSHELKTPLTAIREGADIIDDGVVGPLTQEQQEVTTIIRQSTIRLQRLIENLLRFSVDRAKEAAGHRGRVDFAAIVQGVLDDHKPVILAKSIDLRADIEGAWADGDGDRLRTVVDNLVSNAVKWTPEEGAVRVRLTAEGEMAVVEVCDTGPGIPEEERERVFEPFYQGSAPSQGSVKGTGLGLSIVAEYVAALGGRVDIGEAPEGGARLRVRVPLAGGEVTS